MRIILFNGPPRSGKDTASTMARDHLLQKQAGVYLYRFAEPLKDAVHALFGFTGVDTEHFNALKGEMLDEFFGMTPREAYIWMSEEVAKPKFGQDFFVKIAIRHMQEYADHNIFVVSDCGFQVEADELIKAFGGDNVWVLQLWRTGCDFKKDSRGYITHPKEDHTIKILNGSDLIEFREAVNHTINRILHAAP